MKKTDNNPALMKLTPYWMDTKIKIINKFLKMGYVKKLTNEVRYGGGICRRKSQKSTILNRAFRKAFKEELFDI